MDLKPEQYTDEELIQYIQKISKRWKWLESYHINIDEDKMHAVEDLKEEYFALLKEAKRRNLSFTPKQLVNTILFPPPFK